METSNSDQLYPAPRADGPSALLKVSASRVLEVRFRQLENRDLFSTLVYKVHVGFDLQDWSK